MNSDTNIKTTGSFDRVEFESNVVPEDGSYRKTSELVFDLGRQKDVNLGLYLRTSTLFSSSRWSWDNRLNLRAAYRNAVFSLGVEEWDLFAESRAPRQVQVSATNIHDHNADLRLYMGVKTGVSIKHLHPEYLYVLGGFNFKRNHKFIVNAGFSAVEATKVVDGKEETSRALRKNVLLTSRSRVNDNLESYGELNVSQFNNQLEKSWALANEYTFDKKNRIKTKVTSDKDLVVSFLHSYGVCNFGFITKVRIFI